MTIIRRRDFLQALGAVAAGAACRVSPAGDLPPRTPLKLTAVRRIWDQSPHSAFTDLARFGNRFFCVFREGKAHRAKVGDIRVLSSAAGQKWESAAVLSEPGHDLRDPKLSVTPDGRLMLNGGAAIYKDGNKPVENRSFVSFSEDGRTWGKIQWIVEPNQWLWRVTWHRGKAYGVAYSCGKRPEGYTTLYVSGDGLDYRPLVPKLLENKGASEATLRFDKDGTCYCLQRRDFHPPNRAWLGTSKPPYTKWTWQETAMYFGGPDFLQLPDGRWIAAGRFRSHSDGAKNDAGARTIICELDVDQGYLIPMSVLPSRFDTSYPGMVWHDGKLWVSYYSSREVKPRTYIYLAVLEPQ